MTLTELHARVMAQALEVELGRPEPGAMAFLRCLTPDVVRGLGDQPAFIKLLAGLVRDMERS